MRNDGIHPDTYLPMKAEDYASQFRTAGYSLLATNGPKTWFNLADPKCRHCVQIWDKDNGVDSSVVTAQISIGVRGLMGELKSWEFTLPNGSFGSALRQMTKLDEIVQQCLGTDGNINEWEPPEF